MIKKGGWSFLENISFTISKVWTMNIRRWAFFFLTWLLYLFTLVAKVRASLRSFVHTLAWFTQSDSKLKSLITFHLKRNLSIWKVFDSLPKHCHGVENNTNEFNSSVLNAHYGAFRFLATSTTNSLDSLTVDNCGFYSHTDIPQTNYNWFLRGVKS